MTDCLRNKADSTDGWVFAELLTVLLLAGFFVSALLQTTLCLQRCLAHWETSVRMRQILSTALFQVTREVRMAGCNPKEESVLDGATLTLPDGDEPEQVRIQMDRRGPTTGSPPDGDTGDPGEVIVFRWDEPNQVLRRNNQPLAAQILRNPGGAPVFGLTKDASRGFLRMRVTTGTQGGRLSLSSAVCIRNSL
jgi:hypothetical protein